MIQDLFHELESEFRALQMDNDRLDTKLRECRNELCLRCGKYKTQHLGSCNGCKWRIIDES